MSTNATRRVNDDPPRTDPLETLKRLGVRVCWVRDLGRPAAYVPDCRVMLLEGRLSRAEAYAWVRRWLLSHYPEVPR